MYRTLIILPEQTGNIIYLVYDLQEILMGFVFRGKVFERYFMLHHVCAPFFFNEYNAEPILIIFAEARAFNMSNDERGSKFVC